MARALLSLFACGCLVLTMAARAQTPVQVPQAPQLPQMPGTTASDKLFTKIFPVFASPRCTTCHGIVKHYPGFIHSVTPDTHPGGAVGAGLPNPTVECTDCHDKTEDKWDKTAPPNMEWAGLSEDQVCVQQAAEVRLKNAEAGGDSASLEKSYLHHIASDLLIQQAWVGRAGGARPVVDKDDHPLAALPPPPLPYPEFLADAGEWVHAGAPCKAMGQISHVEEQQTKSSADMGGGQLVVFTQDAHRTVNIARYPNGSATATISASGFYETATTMNLGSCSMVATVKETWSRTGPATVPAKVEVTVKPAEYTITIVLPEETTERVTKNTVSNTCGIPMPPPPDTSLTQKWPEWNMTLHCPTTFPNGDGTMGCLPSEPHDKGAADGALHQTVVGTPGDASDPRSWLLRSPMAVGGPKGESLPVHVQVIWSLVLNKK